MIRQNQRLTRKCVYCTPVRGHSLPNNECNKVIFGTEIKFSQNLMNCYIGNIIHLQDRWKLKYILKRALWWSMDANNIAVKRMNRPLFFVLSSDGFCLQRQIYLDHQLCKVWLTWQCHCCLCCLQNSPTWQFCCWLCCFIHFCPPADVQVVQIELCKVLLQSADHALQSADGVTAPTLFDSVWKSRPLP